MILPQQAFQSTNALVETVARASIVLTEFALELIWTLTFWHVFDNLAGAGVTV